MLSYRDVPKDLAANLRWREILYRRCAYDEEWQQTIRHTCSADILFYINSFVWTYDPRAKTPVLPMITWPEQDATILDIDTAIERQYCLGIRKSRDQGVTWDAMCVLDHKQRFRKRLSFGCISRKEEYVDATDDPDTLFSKLDFIEEWMPSFLTMKHRERASCHVYNRDTGTGIDGESSNANAGAGGRKTAVIRDEEARCENGQAIDRALSRTTECQIRISTPNGMADSFYLAYSGGGFKFRDVHWSTHPVHSLGLYRIDNGKVEILDGLWHERHPGYKFVTEPGLYKALRSPWYDREWERHKSKVLIAQELDMDFGTSGSPWFDHAPLAVIRQQYASEPLSKTPLKAFAPVEVDEKRLTAFWLWCNTDAMGRPPQGKYVIGIDISQGTGASDSVAVVYNALGEKVAEYCTNLMLPEDWATLCVTLARWFHNAHMIWDDGGPGQAFGKRIMERLHYTNVFYYQDRTARAAPIRKTPGFPWAPGVKKELLTKYRIALFSRQITNRSLPAMNECEEIVFGKDGSTPVHVKAENPTDRSDNRESHADRVIADALATWVLDLRGPESQENSIYVPPNSFAGRMQEHERRLSEAGMYQDIGFGSIN